MQGVQPLKETRWKYGLILDIAGYKERMIHQQVKLMECTGARNLNMHQRGKKTHNAHSFATTQESFKKTLLKYLIHCRWCHRGSGQQ
jgi:hypothetical protein